MKKKLDRVNVYLDSGLLDKLKKQAKRSKLSVSGLVNLTVSMWLARK